jgi:hypothetical protein
MSASLKRLRSTQLALFAQPHPKADWRELSPETQQKILRLVTLLLQQVKYPSQDELQPSPVLGRHVRSGFYECPPIFRCSDPPQTRLEVVQTTTRRNR